MSQGEFDVILKVIMRWESLAALAVFFLAAILLRFVALGRGDRPAFKLPTIRKVVSAPKPDESGEAKEEASASEDKPRKRRVLSDSKDASAFED
jgi:hypothetical protein